MKQCVLWVVLGTSSAAFAQPIEPSPATSPGFVTTDRFDATSRVGGELSYLFLSGNGSGTAWRFDLHGQYFDPNNGFGGYAAIPFTLATGSGDSVTGGGDLEVGGFYIPKLATPNFSIVIRAGLTLPTASRDTDSALVNSAVAEGSRPTDLYEMIPRGTSLRLSLSPIVRSGNLFARADIGIDKNLDADAGTNVDAFLRLNAAVGVDLDNAAIMAELVNVHTFGNAQDSWIDQLSLATRLRTPTVQPYAALGFPLNRAVRDNIDAALTVGVEGNL
ncbi:MAG TPA: hypothetical protein VF403_26285 [Kofleriaceae bacterium]